MALPRQQFGLNKFSTSVSQCPVSADSTRAIVLQRNNLAVVKGASTEMELVLSDFYSTINTAEKISLTIPSNNGTLVPYSISKIGDVNKNIKFLAILPSYGTVSNTSEYLEWTTLESIDSGALYDAPIIGPSSRTSFDINKINCFQFGWGSFLSFTGGTGPLWIGTDGGLLKWNGTDTKLWNTLNSNSPSDFINTMNIDSSNNLWIGSNNGLSYFNELSGFSKIFNSENSSLLSDQVNDIKLLSVDKVAIATDLGMSIYNFITNTWESFDIYTTPQLVCNKINRLAIFNTKILLGTTCGIFLYDTSTLSWNSYPFNSANTPGWSAPDDIKSLAVNGTTVYAGTTGGLVSFSYLGGTAQTIFSGSTGPVSSNISALRVEKYGTASQLYVGHDNGISILDIDSNTWGFTADSNNYSELTGINDLIPDFLSGSTSGKTLFFGNSKGINKMFTTGPTFNSVPESNKSTNLLLVYPNDLSLYPTLQPIYFVFSKSMNKTSFEQKMILKDGLTTSSCNTHGATVNGTWNWTYNEKFAQFTPSSEILKATPYTLRINYGATASDSSYLKENFYLEYYTENVVPIGGWVPLGKLMILTGTNEHYIPGIYVRNPQSFDVTLNVLIGII